MSAYWSWLENTLKLTIGARLIFTAFLLIGAVAGAAGTGFAFYNVESGHDPDQALGLQIGFTWVAVAVVEALLLGVLATLDAAFRGIASRFAHPS